ncbi:hypothetical protein KZZ52_38225 [Dactylosporangium sp. AC04546]|uniref:hypothetical protein n=1 Tax=Dactylosporangium sp. AC04546 TaxID=2862460 RepID=UPI001EDCE5FC|nr:hypothetical protein [Dactylosporangium sp. AC04546]WVK79797.1 hypothetical protein KZZ52_38225 [Dactylosporangium sp. AC04546]
MRGWRTLFMVLVTVLVPVFLLDPVLRALLLRHDAALVDGRLRLDTGSWLIHLPLVIAWCWAVTAGAAVTGAARAGVHLRPSTAVRLGLRGLPLVLLALAIAGAAVALEVWTLALVSETRVAWLALLIAFLLVMPFVLVRLALVAPASVLGGLPPGATFSSLLSLVFGVALGPACLVGAAVALHRTVLPPQALPLGVSELLWHVVLLLTAALQAYALGRAFTSATGADEVRRTLSSAAPTSTTSASPAVPTLYVSAASSDASTLFASPASPSSPAPTSAASAASSVSSVSPASSSVVSSLGLLRLAAVVLPAALVATLTLVNPYRLPPIAEGVIDGFDTVMAVGWPAGRPPVVAGAFRVHDCLDDACHRSRETVLYTEANRHASAAAASVAPDGTVTYLLLADKSSGSGPASALLTRCDPARRCDTAQVDLPSLPPVDNPTLAVATAPDGAFLIAVARPLPGGAASELSVIRCADVVCATPGVTVLGTAATQPPARDDGYVPPHLRLLTLTVDEAGVPWVALREPSGPRVWLGTCASGTCTVTERHGPPGRGGPFTALPTGGTVHLGAGRLRYCAADTCSEQLLTADPRDDETAVAWAHGAVYALVTEPVSRLGLGNAGPLADIRRPVVVRCADPTCRQRRTVALAIPPEIVSAAWLAVDPTGRVIIVHDRYDALTVQTLRLP